MFKKLLSNLPFNPSLIGQVSFYAKRMKQESAIRRAGFVFLALALMLQIFATASPAKASLEGSTNDILNSGFQTKDEAFGYCLNGKGAQTDFRAILDYYGVSCDMLKGAEELTIKSSDVINGKVYNSLGRNDQGVTNRRTGKVTNQYTVPIPNALQPEFFMKDLSSWDSGAFSSYKVLKVTSSINNQTVMILFDCGNIVTIGHFDRPTPEEKPSIGYLDDVTCDSIWGWAFDQSKPTASIAVHIYVDGKLDVNLSTGLLADKSRPDVGKAYPEAGNNHGFQIATPNYLKDKQAHKVEAYAIGINADGNKNDVNPSLGAKSIALDCSKPPVKPPKTPCPSNPSLNLGDVKCIPCPSNPSISQGTPECAPCESVKTPADAAKCIVKHKTAANVTQNLTDAQTQPAQPGDVITYNLLTTNVSKDTIKGFQVKEDMNDVLDYALITDFHGGTIDKDNFVYWPAKDIKPSQTIRNQISVKVKSPLPQTNTPLSDKNRFDLVMTNVYGDTINIKLPCVGAKCVEVTTTTLPNTGPGTSLAIGFAVTALAGYFFARSRLFATELDIVREDFANSGGM